MSEVNHIPEVVVWLPELLDEQSRDELAHDLEKKSGIQAAVFCPIRHHLMLVQYDRNDINSQDVLRYVKEGGVDARLVGPI
ncbi:MAG: hypothetical protein OEY45_11630 [Gammaproteobacteria bacterium]|nr:hypothetical protein [Gammaproteobacteria bacterium]